MDPAVREPLVWGLVGGLSFLVLIQGYELVFERGVDLLVKGGGAVVITAVAAGTTAVLRRRLVANERA